MHKFSVPNQKLSIPVKPNLLQKKQLFPTLLKEEISYRNIDINLLSEHDRKKVADEIYEIYTNIFYGWEKDVIYKLLSEEKCILFKVRIFLNGDGKAIGFSWINARYVHYKGKRYTIFFNAGGLDRTVRKKGLITSFFTSVLVKYILLHPFEKIYSFQRLINPASYCAWAKALHEMYPRHDKDTPKSFTQLTSYLSEVFQYKSVREENPFVVHSENFVKLDLDGDKPVVSYQKPEANYFHKLTEGRPDHSLVMLFPCNLKNAVLSVTKNINKGIRRKLQI